MDATKGNIFDILDGKKQFIVPVYQRFYSWDKKQCEKLWEDILYMQNNEKEGHFIGPIVNIAEKNTPTGVNKFMIIDGQQRMTTITILVIALRDYASMYPEKVSVSYKEIEDYLLKNAYKKGDEMYKLILTEQDKESLISLIEGDEIVESANSRVYNNYKFFKDKINSGELEHDKIYEAIGKLQIVNITLERDKDDAQAIFESLNSTGKELSETDLIRNYILMDLDKDQQDNLYKNVWRKIEKRFKYKNTEKEMDRFFRDYLTMKTGKITNLRNIYSGFKEYSRTNCSGNIVSLCEDILVYSEYYSDIIFSKSNDSELAKLYKDIVTLGMEVSYPLLLKVHNDCRNGLIGVSDLKEVLNLCISYVIRRNICSVSSNSMNKTFASFGKNIDECNYMDSFRAYFACLENNARFPKNAEFMKAFKERDIYRMKTRNFILTKLENYDNKNNVSIESLTIEHIMPQNENLNEEWKNMLGERYKEIQAEYIDTIGNLTLTAYNSEMGDRSFNEKLNMDGGFKESALRINRYVIKQDKWNEDKIRERAEILSKEAVKIWCYPVVKEADIDKIRDKKGKNEKYSIESYNFDDKIRELYIFLDKRIMNLSSDVRREYKKYYIAYKLNSNFVDLVIRKGCIEVTVNMKFKDILDVNGICEDITGKGSLGNGDVLIKFKNKNNLDDIMDIIKQSYYYQIEEI